MIKPIQTNDAPQAIGPYSQAIETDHHLFCSGQIGIDPTTGILQDGIEEQTKQVLKNIQAIIQSNNLSIDHIVKTTIFITNIADFQLVNKIYQNFFGIHKPARSTVEVSNLPKEALIEIEAIAIK